MSAEILELASSRDLSSVWAELISGRTRIVQAGATQTHHYVRLATIGGGSVSKKLTARRNVIFERVLLGEMPKVVAMDMGCSPSTVAVCIGDCLRTLGLTGGSNRIPALLVLAFHALRGRARHSDVRVDRLSDDSRGVQMSSARLELQIKDKLSASELSVVALLIEGKSYAEIAAHRSTSVRTIANQLANAYQKLRVSSRMELLCYLITNKSRQRVARVGHSDELSVHDRPGPASVPLAAG
ncbi:MAG TPA: helix-turn-helix transcriptional regulator [Polyangiaceae bacterium]